MRNIVLTAGISLDGYIEGPGREIDWHCVDDELHQHFNDHLRPMGAFISGRVTHELMAEYWPTADQDPSASGPMREFAAIWREKPKYVFSRTLTADRIAWDTTVLHEVTPEGIAELKAQPGGDLTLSGAELTESFLRLDLVDEYEVYVHPVLIGSGKPLFPRAEFRPTTLHLAETRTFGNGVTLLRYRRERGNPVARA